MKMILLFLTGVLTATSSIIASYWVSPVIHRLKMKEMLLSSLVAAFSIIIQTITLYLCAYLFRLTAYSANQAILITILGYLSTHVIFNRAIKPVS